MDPTQSNEVIPEVTPTNTTPPAIQARFDEMTARNHELQAQLTQANQTMAEVAANQARLAAQQISHTPAPQAPQLPDGIDPVMAQFFQQQTQQLLQQQSAMFEQKMVQALGGVRQNQEQLQMQALASGTDPKVTARAQKLFGAWKANGATGFTMEDAFVYAEGQLAKEARSTQRQNAPNGNGYEATTQGGAMPPATNRNLPPAKSDAELNAMSPAQQEAYWASRVGNSEIVY